MDAGFVSGGIGVIGCGEAAEGAAGAGDPVGMVDQSDGILRPGARRPADASLLTCNVESFLHPTLANGDHAVRSAAGTTATPSTRR